jgi:hypothetical protein
LRPTWAITQGLQSGIAIEKLQNKGDTGTIKYFKARKSPYSTRPVSLIDAMPRVYDTQRQIRILNEDGTFDMTMVNQTVIDMESGEACCYERLGSGQVRCDVFGWSGLSEPYAGDCRYLSQMAQYDPSILQSSGDILFQNLDAPGMELIAQRKRQQLLMAGMIPAAQQTDEEKQILAQMQAAQGQKQDPAEVIAAAELTKAQAEAMNAQTKAKTADVEYQEKSANVGMAARREDREDFKLGADIEAREDAHDLAVMKALQSGQAQQMKVITDSLKVMAETMKAIREATGAESIMSPGAAQAFEQQTKMLTGAQQRVPPIGP